MKRVLLWVAAVFYAAGAFLPGDWLWFDPEPPVFQSAHVGETVYFDYSRRIIVDALISYAVVVRASGAIEPACDGKGGPFPYKATRGYDGHAVSLPAPRRDIAYWIGSDHCNNLPAGTYVVSTTWTIARPLRALLRAPFGGDAAPEVVNVVADAFGWLLPPKQVTRVSPPFSILEGAN